MKEFLAFWFDGLGAWFTDWANWLILGIVGFMGFKFLELVLMFIAL